MNGAFEGSSRVAPRAAPPPRTRSILHVDLHPFFVSVERAQDPSLRGLPVIVGGGLDGTGVVAAASAEARKAGVRPGQTMIVARGLCPEGAFRPGDLERYASASEEVTAVLLDASRRVERPSADEAYVDLTRDSIGARAPVQAAEAIKEQLQRRLGLDASLGLASSRVAARVASSWARPRGLLVVLPGYEASYLAHQPVSFLPDLPQHVESALERGGFTTLGAVASADEAALAEAVGSAIVAAALQAAARGEGEQPVAVAAPPVWVQEELAIRDRSGDAVALEEVVSGLAERATRRLRPFDLAAGTVTVEVRRGETVHRRDETLERPAAEADVIALVARSLAETLLQPASTVRAVNVRLSRLQRVDRSQPGLF